MRLWLIIPVLLMSFIATFTSANAIMDLDVKNDRLILPGQNQSLIINLNKPTISEPTDIIMKIVLNGSAYFPDGKKTYEITIPQVPWEGTIFKTYSLEIPLRVTNDDNQTSYTITINATMEYYNTILGYKNTKRSNVTRYLSFNVIWTGRNEELSKDYTELSERYSILDQDYKRLEGEIGKIAKINSDLRDENSGLKKEISTLKINAGIFLFFRIIKIILSIGFIIILAKYYMKKKK